MTILYDASEILVFMCLIVSLFSLQCMVKFISVGGSQDFTFKRWDTAGSAVSNICCSVSWCGLMDGCCYILAWAYEKMSLRKCAKRVIFCNMVDFPIAVNPDVCTELWMHTLCRTGLVRSFLLFLEVVICVSTLVLWVSIGLLWLFLSRFSCEQRCVWP